MGGSETLPAQRARTKTDFSELFRAHPSRQASHADAGATSSPALTPSQAEKSSVTKAANRRSMLPFLGRKKPVEQPACPAPPSSRKSVGNTAQPMTPANTVRRSFGNGHAVFMITPSPNGQPVEPLPPLPPKPPSVDQHSLSLGSKLAAHFTPLRSPSSRNAKARQSMIHKADASAPPVPALSALSSGATEIKRPSMESHHSSVRSRSITPRPLRGPPLTAVVHGDEDFSDLFTLPDQLQRPSKSTAELSVHIHRGGAAKKGGELTPMTPIAPPGPPLHFPIPPSTILPRQRLAEKGLRFSGEGTSLFSRRSGSPSKFTSSGGAPDSGSNQLGTLYNDLSSQDDHQSSHLRTTSISGSDADASRANDPTYSPSNRKLVSMSAGPSSKKQKIGAPNAAQPLSGPPPPVPLPTPPPNPASGSGPRSAPSTPPNRLAFPRSRANTLSATSNLVVPGQSVPTSNNSTPPRSSRTNADSTSAPTVEELQEALSQQRQKNAQLQEYISTITKRYEDDRMAMTRTIDKLEGNIRKKMHEIEGLRWLVVHHGAVSDIDATVNLARSSLSTQEGDVFDSTQLSSGPVVSDGVPFHPPRLDSRGSGVSASSSSAECPNTSSAASISEVSLSTPSLSVIPERTDGITRSERQRLKEERRASKALRRDAVASTFAALGTVPLSRPPPSVESHVDPKMDARQSPDDVVEKPPPFP